MHIYIIEIEAVKQVWIANKASSPPILCKIGSTTESGFIMTLTAVLGFHSTYLKDVSESNFIQIMTNEGYRQQ